MPAKCTKCGGRVWGHANKICTYCIAKIKKKIWNDRPIACRRRLNLDDYSIHEDKYWNQ